MCLPTPHRCVCVCVWIVIYISLVQLKPGCQIPSPCELMGKILIKNKKSSNETQTNTKKTPDPASTTTSTQETPGGSGEARSMFCVFLM